MSNPATPSRDTANDEVTKLVARLVETQWRLEQLIGSQVDSVILPDGQSYLLREAQRKLLESQADLRYAEAVQSAILNALPANIALLDGDGVILCVNESWRSLARTGGLHDPTATVGANYLNICDQAHGASFEGSQEAAAGIRSVLTGRAHRFEFDYPGPAPDERRWYRMRVYRVEAETTPGAVVSVADITESRLAETLLRAREAESRELAEALSVALGETEQQVYARTAELAVAVERADAANLAKSQFLSRMSHELRTPLNAVLGYAQLLNRKYLDPDIKEFSGAILSGGRHLLRLIDELLDIGRVESGELSLSLETVDFDGVRDQVMQIIKPLADTAGVDVADCFHRCGNLTVRADRQRLVQVMINLLSNAVKYNRRGGRVSLSCLRVADRKIRIEVSDTGRGIPPQHQADLFQAFHRFGDHGVEGTGLGLALSYRLVELMGGRLGLAESSEHGSTFFVELSAAETPLDVPATPTADDEAARIGDLRSDLSGEILCVEDNASNMRLLEVVLARCEGVSLTRATTGGCALELARAQVPKLVLLDLHLPDIDGMTVLNRLKSDPTTMDIPVVILSADATPAQVNTLLSGGAADYLTKPLDLARLGDVLGRFLMGP